MPTAEDAIRALDRRWVDAELNSDTGTLNAITTDDFTLVGPLGFVLSKAEWLGRFRQGDLSFDTLTFDEVTVRECGDTAIAIGRQTQRALYQGQPNEGQFRVTQVAVRQSDRWLLATMHISRISTGQTTTQTNTRP
jgi:ketosteroid isomerase-like protein